MTKSKKKNKTNSKNNNTQKGGWGTKINPLNDADLSAGRGWPNIKLKALNNPLDRLCTDLISIIKQEFDTFYYHTKVIPFHLPDRIRYRLLHAELYVEDKQHVNQLRIELDSYISDLARVQMIERDNYDTYLKLIRDGNRSFRLPESVSLMGYVLDYNWPPGMPIFSKMEIDPETRSVLLKGPVRTLEEAKTAPNISILKRPMSQFEQFLKDKEAFAKERGKFFQEELILLEKMSITLPPALSQLLVKPLPAKIIYLNPYLPIEPAINRPLANEPYKHYHPYIKIFEDNFRDHVLIFFRHNLNINDTSPVWKTFADGELGKLLDIYYKFFPYVVSAPYMIRILNSILGLCLLLIANTFLHANSNLVLCGFSSQNFTRFYRDEFTFYIKQYESFVSRLSPSPSPSPSPMIYKNLKNILEIFTKPRIFAVGKNSLTMSIFQRTIYENKKKEQLQILSQMINFTGYNTLESMQFLLEQIGIKDYNALTERRYNIYEFEHILFSQNGFDKVVNLIIPAILAQLIIKALLEIDQNTRRGKIIRIVGIINVFKKYGYSHLENILENQNGICKMLMIEFKEQKKTNCVYPTNKILPHELNIWEYFGLEIDLQKKNIIKTHFDSVLIKVFNSQTADDYTKSRFFLEVLNYLNRENLREFYNKFSRHSKYNLEGHLQRVLSSSSVITEKLFFTLEKNGNVKLIKVERKDGGGKNSKKKNKNTLKRNKKK